MRTIELLFKKQIQNGGEIKWKKSLSEKFLVMQRTAFTMKTARNVLQVTSALAQAQLALQAKHAAQLSKNVTLADKG